MSGICATILLAVAATRAPNPSVAIERAILRLFDRQTALARTQEGVGYDPYNPRLTLALFYETAVGGVPNSTPP